MDAARRGCRPSLASRPCQNLEWPPSRSIFDGETLPDFVDPSVESIEAGVKAFVMQVKYISGR
jgi:hypothetical protein